MNNILVKGPPRVASLAAKSGVAFKVSTTDKLSSLKTWINSAENVLLEHVKDAHNTTITAEDINILVEQVNEKSVKISMIWRENE